MILIKRGAGIDVIEVNPLPSSNMQKSVMGEEEITLSFELSGFVDIRPGDYITYEGSTWTLNKLPQVKKLSSRLWQYTAVFQSTKYELAKAMYMLFDNTPTPVRGEFSLTGNANTFMALLVSNINRTSTSTWSVGQVIENTDYKTLTFSNEDCLSVLARLAGEFDTEYHVNNRVVHLKKISTSRAVNLQYGSTAYDIERSSVDSSDIVTRLYPFGSIKNLRPDYRGGNSPLRIPIAYLDKLENNVSLYGIIERAKTWDEIYPRLSSGGAGIVTSVGNEFTFSDSALDFNVNNYLLDGTTGKVHFTTGQCAGYDFEIKSFNNTTKTFVIAANVEDNDFTVPTSLIKPAVNDKYVLIDIIMPTEYEAAAEAELLAKAQQFLTENSTPKVNYKVTFSEIYARQNLQNIECGDTVGIIDNDLGINEQIRIIKVTKGITDYWNVQFDLANIVSSTRIERIEGSVSNIQNSVVISNQRINRNNLRAYQNTKELQEMVFNVDGYFEPANIKPLSIKTSMLSTGAKSQFFQLTSLLQPNYAGNSQLLHWSAGILTHFTIAETIREWTISAGSITITGGNTSIPLYIYARCFRTGTTGAIYLNSAAIKPDSDPTYFYFLIGVLHSPISDVRGISLNYGQTTINGGFIKTGVIQSIDGATYFNLNTGNIAGNIQFIASDGTLKTVDQAIGEIKIGGINYFRKNETPSPAVTFVSIPTRNAMLPYVGQKMTVSFEIKASVNATVLVYHYQTSGVCIDFDGFEISANTNYQRITATGEVISNAVPSGYSDGAIGLYHIETGATISVRNIQIETGTKATDYKLNPQDEHIGGANKYTTSTPLSISSTGGSTPSITRNGNGFDIVSSDGSYQTTARVSNVIDDNGEWVVSGWAKINASVAEVDIQINDQQLLHLNLDSNWQRFEATIIVSNYSESVYNFVDFETTYQRLIQVKDFMVQRGNRASSFQDGYLARAFEDSTDINGGVIGTSLVRLREGGIERGGISGLNENVLLWGGGTYPDAVSEISKLLIRKDGSGYLSDGKLRWDTDGNLSMEGSVSALSGQFGLLKIVGGSILGDRIKIANTSVDSLSAAIGLRTFTIPYIISLQPIYKADLSKTISSAVVTVETPTTISFVKAAFDGADLYLFSDDPSDAPVLSSDCFCYMQMRLRCINNDKIVAESNSAKHIIGAIGGTYFYPNGLWGAILENIAIEAGTVYFELTCTISDFGPGPSQWQSGSIRLPIRFLLTSDNSSMKIPANISISSYVRRSMLGLDGFYSFANSNRYLYFRGANDSSDIFQIRLGSYILRMTEANGLQRSSDGGSSWQTL